MIIYNLILAIAHANRLEEAARRWTDTSVNIAQFSALGGITLGAALCAFGLAQVGKTILLGGVFCAICVFGGPAIIETIRSLF